MFEILIKPSAEKHMDRLPVDARRRVVNALTRLRDNPRPPGSVKLVSFSRWFGVPETRTP
jgi:mRNA-degrading endonuclease RelE of RelBE toxin-antitoxin system